MLILSIRTDKPEAEVGLFSESDKLAYLVWNADRQLSETIHQKIRKLLTDQNKTLEELDGIICFKGPGSFTGLRIGISVVNSLAYGLNINSVGTTGKNWIDEGISRLSNGENKKPIIPEYGAPPHITLPKR